MNVLITGGARGLGRTAALAFAREGHNVAVNYRSRRAEADETVTALRDLGVQAEAFPADVAHPDQARKLVDAVVEKWGTLDGLINNAGIARDRSVLRMTVEEWREVLDTNLSGSFYCLQAAAKHMIRRKNGFILNIGSFLGVQGGLGCVNYSSAKAGLMGLTKSAAQELGRFNVRVNLVLPGFHLTDLGASLPTELKEDILSRQSLGRHTDPEEFGKFLVLLAGQRTISGQLFNVDSRIL